MPPFSVSADRLCRRQSARSDGPEVIMQILIIAGFLGAGKTRFIQNMAKATGRQFVIVENEFGDLSLDGEQLLSDSAGSAKASETADAEGGEMNVWELTEGCICCSMNLDFSHSVLTIANTLDPDYLIVEPSGVAQLTRILDQLRKICYERIGVLAPVTVVDVLHYRSHREQYPACFLDQIAGCGTLVLTKSENLSADDLARIRDDLHPAEDVQCALQHYSLWPKELWLNLLNRTWVSGGTQGEKERFAERDADSAGTDPRTAGFDDLIKQPDLEHLTLKQVDVRNPGELVEKVEWLASGAMGQVVRAKGTLACGTEYLHFELAGRQYTVQAARRPREAGLVVIGSRLRRVEIRRLFETAADRVQRRPAKAVREIEGRNGAVRRMRGTGGTFIRPAQSRLSDGLGAGDQALSGTPDGRLNKTAPQ